MQGVVRTYDPLTGEGIVVPTPPTGPSTSSP